MNPKDRRKHLHASVSAGVLIGLAIGLWIGMRAGQAGWIEGMAFALFVVIGPAMIMSRIDTRFRYSDE